jgi:hypothetical protein
VTLFLVGLAVGILGSAFAWSLVACKLAERHEAELQKFLTYRVRFWHGNVLLFDATLDQVMALDRARQG